MTAARKARVVPKARARKQLAPPAHARREAVQPDQAALAVFDLWREEVKGLSGLKIKSFEEGLEKLIEKVLCRFGMKGHRDLEAFLYDAISADPDICAELETALGL